MSEATAQITQLLSRLRAGDGRASDQLMPLLYADLHARAAAMMRREQDAVTLQPTALLNEAWLRLQTPGAAYADRGHFLRLAGRVMRHVLVDHARRRRRRKAVRSDLELAIAIGPEPDQRAEILDLQHAMQQLAAKDPELEEIVELRFFSGLTLQETADALGKTTSSVHRAWELARAFLLRELKHAEG